MEKPTSPRAIVFKVIVLILLVTIVIYQINLDRKITTLQQSVQQATSSADEAATSAEKVRVDIKEIADRLGV